MRFRRLVIMPEASDDIEKSYHYYEARCIGLGERFREKLVERLTLIQSNPELFNIVSRNLREAVLRVFPFKVIFEVEGDDIKVYSVFHTSRKPKKKFKK